MNLSPELKHLKSQEQSYEPSTKVRQQMAQKTLIALIGPTAVGKSTLAREIVAIGGQNFAEVNSSLTRSRRDDDPLDYVTADEGFTVDKATHLISQGDVANYSIHPSGNIYTTLPRDFPATYNLLPLLPSSLAAMKKANFNQVHAIYVVASPSAIKAQLAERVNDPSLPSRLREGVDSLQWALENTDQLTFVQNIHQQPAIAARQIISLVEDSQPPMRLDQGVNLARQMLSYLQGQL